MRFFEFHDTQLSRIVEHAYHAVAVNENRIDYDVCLWNPPQAPTQTLEQRWFVGAHTGVGGGDSDSSTSDIALRWMQDKASASGLGMTPVAVGPTNHLAPYRDSYQNFLNGAYATLKPRHFRRLGATLFGHEVIDETVHQRIADDPAYQPENTGLSN